MPGPLDGIVVVDCSAYIAGPFATMVLADQGADVIKIEPVGIGDVMRHLGTTRGGISTLFAGCNRGKRSLAVNLREERGRALVHKLVETADVFVQNYRPGVADRIGLGEPELRAINSELIYVSVSAFGATGPWSKKPAFDHVIQAASGVAAVQTDPDSGEPRFVQNAVVDKVTALTVAQATTAALLHRARTGEGQHVELSMLAAALQFIWPDGMARETLLGDGVELRAPISDAYRMIALKDGFMAAAAVTQEQLEGLMRAVERPELLEDERFSTVNNLIDNLAAFGEEVREAAARLTVAQSVANFEREDVPCAAVARPADVPENPQVVSQDMIEDVEHPRMGPMRRPRPAARFSGTPCPSPAPAPTLGGDGDALLASLGLDETELADLRAKGIVG